MESITLYEEYRLIERSESEVNAAWKGAHLLLFFLAFVFGSFCTFCFHMLMYLFDEKCVLFPKLLSLTTLRQHILHEFIPKDKEIANMLPVDFLSTQWVDKSACYLPTYVPLVSGIFGLVWTAMFLMCSTGARNLTGLQRPWRVLLPVFVFSLAMGGLCLYATLITHSGLQELCLKLGEITGSSTCTYTMNVATLAYERRIRGVYQATRITILSAWLHTLCWLLSALMTLIRVLLVIDFQLVKVSVQLKGNIDEMLERQETLVGTVSPDVWMNKATNSRSHTSTNSQSSVKVHFQKREQTSRFVDTASLDSIEPVENEGRILFTLPHTTLEPSLVEDERNKLDRSKFINSVPEENQFLVKILYDQIDMIDKFTMPMLSPNVEKTLSLTRPITRLYSSSKTAERQISELGMDPDKAEKLVLEIKRNLEQELEGRISELETGPSTSKITADLESVMNITSETKNTIKEKVDEPIEKLILKRQLTTLNVKGQILDVEKPDIKKSSLKIKKVQTDGTKTISPRVQTTESRSSVITNIFKSDTEIDDKKQETDEQEKEKKD